MNKQKEILHGERKPDLGLLLIEIWGYAPSTSFTLRANGVRELYLDRLMRPSVRLDPLNNDR